MAAASAEPIGTSPPSSLAADKPVSPLDTTSSEETITGSDNKEAADSSPTYVWHPSGWFYWDPVDKLWKLSTTIPRGPHTFELHRHYGALWLSGFFAVLAILSWSFICILKFRPLYSSTYDSLQGLSWHETTRSKNMTYYRASQVLESFVSMLTLPVATAVCVKGAVTFTQKQKHRVKARQALVLADRAWTSISTIWNVLLPGWRQKNMSSFLLYALLLSAFGFVLAPVKSILVTQDTIKTPRQSYNTVSPLTDFPDLFWEHSDRQAAAQLVGLVRSRFMSTTLVQPQTHLWVRNLKKDCGKICNEEPYMSFNLLWSMTNPFMSQVPSFYNTGLIRQHALRLNSSATWSKVSPSSLPPECGNSSINFYKKYSDPNSEASLELCMPGNLTSSIWAITRDRQDITETLYCRISAANGTVEVVRIDAATSSGYFELPNIMNDNTVGPLLNKGPDLGVVGTNNWRTAQLSVSKQDLTGFGYGNRWPQQVYPGIPLENIINRGPLLTTVLALFGDGSLLSIGSNGPNSHDLHNSIGCGEWDMPFITMEITGEDSCQIWANVSRWGWLLNGPNPRPVEFIFEKALYLANEAWVTESLGTADAGMQVNSDPGIDTIVPAMTFASMIVISVLLIMFLVGLFAMALYSCSQAHWTGALDSFAILRIGASAGDKLSYEVGQKLEDIDALDEIPCWVGDALPEDQVGKLVVGAEEPLKRKRTYTFRKTSSAPV